MTTTFADRERKNHRLEDDVEYEQPEGLDGFEIRY
jgi:hypothetical protein